MTGATSASANSRAVRRASSCSAVSSKSIARRDAPGWSAASAVPPDRAGADHHQETIGGKQPRAGAAVAREERLDQLGGMPRHLGGRRACAHELLHGEEHAQDAEGQPPNHAGDLIVVPDLTSGLSLATNASMSTG